MQILHFGKDIRYSTNLQRLQAVSKNPRWVSVESFEEAKHYLEEYYIAAALISEEYAFSDALLNMSKQRTSVFAYLKGSECRRQLSKLLEIGYDDVFFNYQSPTDILLKMRSSIRRRHGNYQDEWSFFGLGIDPCKGIAVYGNRTMDFSALEASILEVLILNRNRAVPREEMLDYLYFGKELPDDRVLDVTISKIRGKIRALSGKNPIQAVRGVGYQIASQT